MKKRIALTITIVFLLFIFPLRASHIMGGEITWKCLKSGSNAGKYVFTLKIYRHCSGSLLSSSQIISSNSPAGPITVNRTSQQDLSPSCYLGQAIDCYATNKDDFAIEENIYDNSANPIALNGIPPVTGWNFNWAGCCRASSPIMDNLHPQNQSYQFETRMYPYNNQNANPCFDSSPEFAELTLPLVCSDYYFQFPSNVTDENHDSIVFSLVAPLQALGTPVTYAKDTNTDQVTPRPNGGGFIVPAPGFSATMPLPWGHVNMDTRNQPAVLDAATGMLNFLSYTPGRYAIGIQAKAYRCGQHISTITRDIEMILLDCPPLPPPMSSIYNEPPNVTFFHNGFPIGIELKDTVYAGDLVEFELMTSDAGLLPGLIPQTITVKPHPNHFGNLYSDSLNGCDRPPCATADTASGGYVTADNNWQAIGSSTLKFRWRTSCNHITGNGSCQNNGETYLFHFKTTDDYCPVPGQNNVTAAITILPDTSTMNQVVIDSIDKSNNYITLHWTPYTGPGFTNYHIYKHNNTTGKFEIISSIANASTSSFTDTNVAPNQYFISLNTDTCGPQLIYSDISLSLSAVVGGSNIDLSWNRPFLFNHSHTIKYLIYRKIGASSYTLFDSTLNITSYQDTTLSCSDTATYYVEALVDGVHFTNSLPHETYLQNITAISPRLTHTLVDVTGNVTIKWDTLANSDITFATYVIYVSSDSTGPFIALDSVLNKSTGQYLHFNAGADTAELYYYIKIKGTDNCHGTPTLSARSNILGTLNLNITSLNNGYLELNWTPFFNKNNKSANYYFISRRYGTVPWTLIDSTTLGNENYTDTVIVCNDDIYYKVAMDSMGLYVDVVSSINISGYRGQLQWIGNTTLVGPTGVTYSWYKDGAPIPTAGNNNSFVPTFNGTYYLVVTLNNGCVVTTDTVNITTIGINEVIDQTGLALFPNPHTGQFEVTLLFEHDEDVKLELLDNTGRSVLQKQLSAKGQELSKVTIDMFDQPKGLYLLRIHSREKTEVKKVMYR